MTPLMLCVSIDGATDTVSVVDASVPTEQPSAAATGESHHVLLPTQHRSLLPREQEVCPPVRHRALSTHSICLLLC